ncbi:nucleoside recognition domain-containing protein [Paludibacter jiangxiensis]|uniref:Nucleoside recognition n=1 Tax=Paludibacter jiangxiensis TaxID=681398 RepID=A0A161LSN8_9BACT|nr:nucleoside recognition domain-containing protein [Paludibacter jiangxiensis]GAT63810.1 nucleoside recognition [Paludibacter jiangxiensis]
MQRVISCIRLALPKATHTIVWLLKLMLPVALLVSFLQYWGVMDWMAQYLSPVFTHIGLPGASAIVFITSLFLPLYSVLAVIATMTLGMREITILAIMCLISHSLIIETAVQKRTGSSVLNMLVVRIGMSFTAALLLNWLLPTTGFSVSHSTEQATHLSSVTDVLLLWAKSSMILIIKVSLILYGLFILQNLLNEFKWLDKISNFFAPLMKFFGLSREVSFLWFVAQTLGLAYGSAVVIEQVEKGIVNKRDANMLNYHIAVNHSLLEDTLLFVSIGVSMFWIVVPRIGLAFLVVWGIHAIRRIIPSVKL